MTATRILNRLRRLAGPSPDEIGEPTDPMDCEECCARQAICPRHLRRMREDAREAMAALVLIHVTRGDELGEWWRLAKEHGVVVP